MMNAMEKMALQLRALEKRIATLEARERSLTWGFATEDFGLVDAGSAGATQQDWIEVEVGGNQGFIRVYASE